MTGIRTSLARLPSGTTVEEMRQRARYQAERAWHTSCPILVVALDDERLSWPERELIRQLGDKLNGGRGKR
jgi:hypothetical protein